MSCWEVEICVLAFPLLEAVGFFVVEPDPSSVCAWDPGSQGRVKLEILHCVLTPKTFPRLPVMVRRDFSWKIKPALWHTHNITFHPSDPNFKIKQAWKEIDASAVGKSELSQLATEEGYPLHLGRFIMCYRKAPNLGNLSKKCLSWDLFETICLEKTPFWSCTPAYQKRRIENFQYLMQAFLVCVL